VSDSGLGEIGSAYRGCRRRITDLLESIDAARAASPVPACPGWSVHDVLAHLSGGIADAMAGRMEGAGEDHWTARQVEERREIPVPHVLAEWNVNAPKIEQILDQVGDIGRQAVDDVVNHEHDIRAALGEPGARDTDAVRIGLSFSAPRLIESAAGHGASLRVEIDDGAAYGPEDATVRLRGSAFELLRATTGRRSVEQLRALDWEGDSQSVIPAFSWYSLSPAKQPIQE
jgi:uncharacterized protein (TIGR03083 family)